jgi:hypothetical protein
MLQATIKLQNFIDALHLEPVLGHKMQHCAQLNFNLNGVVGLAAALDTPEVSRTLREEVLDLCLAPRSRCAKQCFLLQLELCKQPILQACRLADCAIAHASLRAGALCMAHL